MPDIYSSIYTAARANTAVLGRTHSGELSETNRRKAGGLPPDLPISRVANVTGIGKAIRSSVKVTVAA
jgi:hypothetical protein